MLLVKIGPYAAPKPRNADAHKIAAVTESGIRYTGASAAAIRIMAASSTAA